MLEKLRHATSNSIQGSRSPEPKKYNPNNKEIKALKDEMGIALAHEEDLPMKSAIPQQILDNPYYALILDSVGATGSNPDDDKQGEGAPPDKQDVAKNIASQIPHLTLDVIRQHSADDISYDHLKLVKRHFVNSSRRPFA